MKLANNQSNLEMIGQLIQYAFNKKTRVIDEPTFLSRYHHATCFGTVNEHQRITSLVMANDFQVAFHQKNIKMAGIGYVSSFPEARGDGSISQLMQELLLDLYERNYLISNLAPFSERFYRKFGYENAIFTKNYQMTANFLEQFPTERTGEVIRGRWQDEKMRLIVQELYQQIINSKQECNTVIREEWWWHRLDCYYSDRYFAIAYDRYKQPVGYLIYRMIANEFLIDELVYTTGFALRKLLTFVKSHASSFQAFKYSAPCHERLEILAPEHQGLTISIKPYMMTRIINFPELLKIYPFDSNEEFIFEVTEDCYCPWNQGKWLVKGDGMDVVKVDATACQSDLAGPIQSWSALILGDLTVEAGLLLEKFKASNNRELDNHFLKGKVSFYDYF
ncbi:MULTISPECIES: GNAT family N-acetyltransferase [unclassified Enterococcus]|uniref:GNAT family N-acetyltransferase n=1 Tax=unclassified Enterococcus TaxID=2608891 RepID=UPI001555589A|nr:MULTISPECIES: GNAT family N-acetyltransferase [unclassified Enterococcus]MBS7577034.1 GNAT family N-acetyltransferase [Enterococcus sp. MMGLQ5-2]MBS7584519.1 GNAT family N-acetyltransferase [Enterococcus sp. MMGLQ5-1]NPD12374.1 GNAT family N-acetyltransferase [Enterococcus sp. MMGLQ5-1]NPD36868.1 GNAT family N-acetyltransferase [Enterococcus sp. MMGLQ5-2]